MLGHKTLRSVAQEIKKGKFQIFPVYVETKETKQERFNTTLYHLFSATLYIRLRSICPHRQYAAPALRNGEDIRALARGG